MHLSADEASDDFDEPALVPADADSYPPTQFRVQFRVAGVDAERPDAVQLPAGGDDFEVTPPDDRRR